VFAGSLDQVLISDFFPVRSPCMRKGSICRDALFMTEMASQVLEVRMSWGHVGPKAGSEGGAVAQPRPVRKMHGQLGLRAQHKQQSG
jgi:hypothetical protein